MNKEEIKDLIASKIAGQGSAVDAGSALPEILNGLVDAISSFTVSVDEVVAGMSVEISKELYEESKKAVFALAPDESDSWFHRTEITLAGELQALQAALFTELHQQAEEMIVFGKLIIEGVDWEHLFVGTAYALIFMEDNSKYYAGILDI